MPQRSIGLLAGARQKWGDHVTITKVTYKIAAPPPPFRGTPTYPHIEINIIHVISLETKKNNMNNFAMSNKPPPKHRVPYVGGYAIV